MRTLPPLLLASALLLVAACSHRDGGSGDADDRAVAEAADPADTPAVDVDALRSLPYAGYDRSGRERDKSGVTLHDPGRAAPGYTLYVMNDRAQAELIDMDGAVVRGWKRWPGRIWWDAELLPDGDLVVVGADSAAVPYPLIDDDARYALRLGWNGDEVWRRPLHAHHDIRPLSGGRFLLITLVERTIPELCRDMPVVDDRLNILDQDGNLLESHSVLDMIRQDPRMFPLNPHPPGAHAERRQFDLLHGNTAFWIEPGDLEGTHPVYGRDHILMCFRHQDRIAVFDWREKRMVWAWGFQQLSGPHDARLLPGGNILVFDNGLVCRWSRVIEMDPRTGKIVWEYHAPDARDFFTVSKGSAQRLPNGNTLVTNSDSGQVFEVTAAGERVWEFWCPHRNEDGDRATIFSAKRYPAELIERLLEAGG